MIQIRGVVSGLNFFDGEVLDLAGGEKVVGDADRFFLRFCEFCLEILFEELGHIAQFAESINEFLFGEVVSVLVGCFLKGVQLLTVETSFFLYFGQLLGAKLGHINNNRL